MNFHSRFIWPRGLLKAWECLEASISCFALMSMFRHERCQLLLNCKKGQSCYFKTFFKNMNRLHQFSFMIYHILDSVYNSNVSQNHISKQFLKVWNKNTVSMHFSPQKGFKCFFSLQIDAWIKYENLADKIFRSILMRWNYFILIKISLFDWNFHCL